jgi:hypothetical protein
MPKFCHEERVDLLFGLACLVGCRTRQRSLGKDSIPDVVATNTSGSVLFIGDEVF